MKDNALEDNDTLVINKKQFLRKIFSIFVLMTLLIGSAPVPISAASQPIADGGAQAQPIDENIQENPNLKLQQDVILESPAPEEQIPQESPSSQEQQETEEVNTLNSKEKSNAGASIAIEPKDEKSGTPSIQAINDNLVIDLLMPESDGALLIGENFSINLSNADSLVNCTINGNWTEDNPAIINDATNGTYNLYPNNPNFTHLTTYNWNVTCINTNNASDNKTSASQTFLYRIGAIFADKVWLNQGAVTVGDILEFELNATNGYLNNQTDIYVYDLYNTSFLNFTNASIPPLNVNYSTGNVTWAFNLSSMEVASILVNFTAINAGNTSNAVATYLNGTEEDFISSENITINPMGMPNATVKKIAFNPTYNQNDVIEYKINVTNLGDMTLDNITLRDDWNSSLINFNASTCALSDSNISGGWLEIDVINCLGNNLTQGSSFIMLLNYTYVGVDPVPLNVTNDVMIYGYGPNNATDSEDVEILGNPGPPVSVDKSLLTQGAINVGDNVSFEINISNNQNENATNVTVYDIYNIGNLNFTTANIAPYDVNYTDGNVTWIINITNQTRTTLIVNFTAIANGMTTNQVDVYYNGTKEDNGSAMVDVGGGTPGGNLNIQKKLITQGTVNVGDNVSFTVNVTNGLSDNATNLTIYDTYSPGLLNFTGANVTPDNVDYGTNNITWNFNISNGTLISIEVNFTALSGGMANNDANLYNSSNNLVSQATANVDIQSGGGESGNYTPLWSQAQNATNFTQDIFDFSGAPYVARGPGCKLQFDQYENASPGQNCCNNGGCQNGSVALDLGAVFVDQAEGYIAWSLIGPGTKNITLASCTGTPTKAAFVVEFDVDDNASTGCDNGAGEGCYPGSDYQIWYFPDNHTSLFAYYNGSADKADGRPAGGTCPDNICFVANTSVDVQVSVNCLVNYSDPSFSKADEGFVIVLNKSALPSPISLNFETNSFNVTQATTNPIDQLTDNGVEKFLFSGPGEDKGACFQFDGNQAACENATDEFYCVWNQIGSEGLCDPDFNNFQEGAACFTYNNQTACEGSELGYCKWLVGAKTPEGTQDICVEQFKPEEFGGGDCDTDCFNCFTEKQCNASNANGGNDYGGCSWYNDTFNPAGWCDIKGLAIGCSQTPKGCFDSTSCTNAGWFWNSGYQICQEQSGAEVCFNGIDDDSDGNVDCADYDCQDLKSCGAGIDLLTGDYAGFSPEEALEMKISQGMGPVILLKDDEVGDGSGNLDIIGSGISAGPLAVGIGTPIVNLSDLKACGGPTEDRKFMFFIDKDANSSTGCNVTIDGQVERGYDFLVKYGNYSVANDSAQTRLLFACYNDNWVQKDAVVLPTKAGDPMMPGGGTPIECGDDKTGFDAVVAVLLEKASIGNPKGDMMFSSIIVNGSWDNYSDLKSYDSLLDAYYTPGTVDFEPVDCFEEPTKCGSEFMVIGGGEFMPFEDCLAPGDEDLDGLENCADPDCIYAPHCANDPNKFNISADKTAPKTKSSKVEVFNDVAFVMWATNEPTNGSIVFYRNDSNCNTINHTVTDAGLPGTFDDFRPWHNAPLDDIELGYFLDASTTYYYKILNYDQAGNKGQSKCLNFTTLGSPKNVSLLFNFTPPVVNASDFLGNMKIEINGQEKGIGTAFEESDLSNVNVTIYNPNATPENNWSIELVGADIVQEMDIDFSDKFIANNSGDYNDMIGMPNLGWDELSQKMGVDYINLKIPEGGAVLYHCDDDGLNCTDVTNQSGVELLNSTENWTEWKVPSSLGFTTYSAGSENYSLIFLNITEMQRSSNVSVSDTYQVNITNNDTNAREYNFTLNVSPTANFSYSLSYDSYSFNASETITLNITANASVAGEYYFNVTGILANNSSITLNSYDDLATEFLLNVTGAAPAGQAYENISSCPGESISTGTEYRLQNDLDTQGEWQGNYSWDCFNIYQGQQNVIIDCQNYDIIGNQSARAFFLANGVSNITIKNCNISNVTNGIYHTGSSTDLTIQNNTFSQYTASEGAIVLYGVNSSTIANNSVDIENGTKHGIVVVDGYNNILEYNYLTNLSSAGYTEAGIHLGYDPNPVFNTTVRYNTFYEVSVGLRLNNASGSTIYNNNFIDGRGRDVITWSDSTGNSFYNNNFTSNMSVQDNVVGNTWNTTTTGNFWVEYNGVDNYSEGDTCIDDDEDGFCDTPYLLDGTAGAIDFMPIYAGIYTVELNLTKDASNYTPLLGDTVTFTLNLTNADTVNVSNVTLVDSYNTSELNYTGSNVTPSLENISGGTLEWDLNLTVGQEFIVEVNFTTLVVDNITNDAGVINESDTILVNDSVEINSGEDVNLTVTKKQINEEISFGEIAEFEINVSNSGSTTALEYLVGDDYNNTFLNYSTSSQTVDYENFTEGSVEWLVNVSSGGTETIYVNFTTLQTGNSTNLAFVEDASEVEYDNDSVNVEIVAQPPFLASMLYYNNGSSDNNLSLLTYGETVDYVSVNCSNPENQSAVANATFVMLNVPDTNYTINSVNATSNTNEIFTLNVTDFPINDSGNWFLQATCILDNATTVQTNGTALVSWGTLATSIVDPASGTNVQKNTEDDVIISLTCTGGECQDVNLFVSGYDEFTSSDANPLNSSNDPAFASFDAGHTENATWTLNATGNYGTYEILANASHITAIYSTDSVNLTIADNTVPVVEAISPGDGLLFANATQVLTFNVTDSLDSSLNCSLYINSSYNTSATKNTGDNNFTLTLPEGDTAWYVNCTDTYGNENGTTERTVSVDTVAPVTTVILTGTSGNNNWYTSDVNINFSVVETNLNRTQYNLTGNWTNFTAPFDITTEANNTLHYRSIDEVDNTESTNTIYIAIDKSAPTINLFNISPANGTSVNSTDNVTVTVNLSDSNAQNYSFYINGVLDRNLPYTSGVEQSFNWTDANSYVETNVNFSIVAFDDAGNNVTSSTLTLFVNDISGPTVTLQTPTSESLTNNQNIVLVYNATDTQSLANCTIFVYNSTLDLINSSTNTSVSNGLQTHTPGFTSDGVYHWNATCADGSNNIGTSQTWNFTLDTIAPTYSTLTELPANSTTYVQGQIYYFNVTFADSVAFDTAIMEFDGSNTTVTSGSSVYEFNVSDLAVGTYNYTWYGNDTASNENNTGILTYTVSQATPACSLTFDKATPQTYGTEINASCSCDGEATAVLYRNTTDITAENNLLVNVTAGDWLYNCTSAATQNYTAAENSSVFVVNKASTTLNLSSDAGWTVTYPTQTNVSCTATPSAGTITLLREGGSVSNPDVQTLGVGTYNYSCSVAATENYTANNTEQTLTVNQNTSTSCTLTLNQTTGNYGDQIIASCECVQPEANATLYRNGTDVTATENNTATTLGVGFWDYVCNVSATTNYAAANDTDNVTISQATDTLAIFLNGLQDQNISVAYNGTVTANGTSTSGTHTIYRNGSLITPNNAEVLAVGWYAYKINSTGNENYSANAGVTYYVNITQPSPQLNLSLNGAEDNASVNVGATVVVTGSKQTAEGTIELLIAGTLNQSSSTMITQNITYNTPGTFNVSLRYNATENYSGELVTRYVIVGDNVAPVITLTSPNNDTWTTTAPTTFNYTVIDAHSGITNCSLYLNGSIEATNSSITEGSNWFTGATTNGTNTWYVKCYDDSTAENSNTSETRIVKVDTTLPSTTISGVINGTTYIANVTINLSASDTFSGVNYTEYNISGSWQTYSAPFNYGTEGQSTIYYRTVDVAGNVETTNELTFTIDTTAPVSVVNLTSTPLEPEVNVDSVYVYLNATGGANGTLTMLDPSSTETNYTMNKTGNQYYHNFTNLTTLGKYQFTAIILDSVGNSLTQYYNMSVTEKESMIVNGTENQTLSIDNASTVNASLDIGFLQNVSNIILNLTLFEDSPYNLSINDSIKYLRIDENGSINSSMGWTVIKMYYLASEILGLSESSLTMYWYNESSEQWVALNDSIDFVNSIGVNTSGNYVWANVTHFSTYGAAGDRASCTNNAAVPTTGCYYSSTLYTSGYICDGSHQATACDTGDGGGSGGGSGGGGGVFVGSTTNETANETTTTTTTDTTGGNVPTEEDGYQGTGEEYLNPENGTEEVEGAGQQLDTTGQALATGKSFQIPVWVWMVVLGILIAGFVFFKTRRQLWLNMRLNSIRRKRKKFK